MQVLLLLIERAGQTVTKDQIFEQIWAGKFVTDDILSVTISKIRKALNDKARSPTFIKTVPGEGYVLIAQAQRVESQEGAQSENKKIRRISIAGFFLLILAGMIWYFIPLKPPPPSGQLKISSIAVLPFDDLGSEEVNQYITDGLSDAIINQLSQNKYLKVISRYSSFNYRGEYRASEIGKALDVEVLLDGSVQIVDEKVRVNVRIFSTDNGQQLWSKTFDDNEQDIFTFQDNISKNIQKIVNPDFLPPVETDKSIDAQAYEWFLMGQYHWRQRNPESLEKAVTYFEYSLELEPDYVDAHVGISVAYHFLHSYGNWTEEQAYEAAIPHVNRALELNPNSAAALSAKGLILTGIAAYLSHLEQDVSQLYQQAHNAFQRSLELQSNAMTHLWYSSLLWRTGNESGVLQHMNKAIELNPLSASLKRRFSFALYQLGKVDSARRMFQRALLMEPHYISRHIEYGQINRYSPELISKMSAWHYASPDLLSNCSSIEYCEHLAFMYLSLGANEEADKILSKMDAKHFHFLVSLAAIEASAKGDELEALHKVEQVAQLQSHLRRPQRIFDYAIAKYRAGKFEQAKGSLLRLHPRLAGDSSITTEDISADNYQVLMLFAATLSRLLQNNEAEYLFHQILIYLDTDRVFNRTEVEFNRAQIHSQLGNTESALKHLESALNMGWMETFSKEWWSLSNDHFLLPLREESEFQSLLNMHEMRKEELRQAIAPNLNEMPGSL